MTITDKLTIFLKLLSIFIAVVAIIGNTLVCHVIVRLKSMKTSINYIVLNLAILDAFSSIVTIYFVFAVDHRGVLVEPALLEQAYNQSSILSSMMCKFELFYWLPVSISPMLLMIMAYERYKAIVDPLSRVDGRVTKGRLKWMLPLAWITGLAYIITDMSLVQYVKSSGSCNYLAVWYNFEVFILSFSITQFIIPSTAIVVLYARVIFMLKRQDNALGPQAEAERVRRKAKKKVMRTIIIVTLVFYIFCAIPQALSVPVNLYLVDQMDVLLFDDVVMVLLAMNLAFNPCAYFRFMQSFRNGFHRLFMSQRESTAQGNALATLDRTQSSACIQDMNKNVTIQQENEPQLLAFRGTQENGC